MSNFLETPPFRLSPVFKALAIFIVFFPVFSLITANLSFSRDDEKSNTVQFEGKARDLLSLTGYEFKSYIGTMKEKYGKDRLGFIGELQSKKFTCNFSPSGARFECIRFGCKRAFLFSKYLMQWSVSPEILNSNAYNATTIYYQLAKGCYRPEDVTKEQEKFVFRHGQLK